MKKYIFLCIACLLAAGTAPARALEFAFDAPESGNFGKPTTAEIPAVIETQESYNVNRGKNAALIPPPFGSPTADLPGSGESLTPNLVQSQTASNPGGTVTVISSGAGTSVPALVSPVTQQDFTLPDGLYYADGSLGTLKIPSIGVNVKVYETESMESLAKGAGHFKSTSCWNGNVGIAGHNRGVNNYFGKLKKLSKGDKITYTTKLGTRTYQVFFSGQISASDFSRLSRTEDNILTLITCVENKPSLRVCVQARQVD